MTGALLPNVLDGYARGLGDEEAWRAATGKSPAAEYAALTAELWGAKASPRRRSSPATSPPAAANP